MIRDRETDVVPADAPPVETLFPRNVVGVGNEVAASHYEALTVIRRLIAHGVGIKDFYPDNAP
jgi:hypothetical protein